MPYTVADDWPATWDRTICARVVLEILFPPRALRLVLRLSRAVEHGPRFSFLREGYRSTLCVPLFVPQSQAQDDLVKWMALE